MALMIRVSEIPLRIMARLLKVPCPSHSSWLFFFLRLSLLYFSLTRYASICPARVIMDRESGRSRGFGFVTYTSSEEASAAITAMDGQVSSYLIVFIICLSIGMVTIFHHVSARMICL